MLFTKSIEWAYEKEYRIIRFLNNSHKLDYLDKNGYEIFVHSFPKELIKGIIWGGKIEREQKEKIIDSIKSNGYSNIVCKQAELSPEDYLINIVTT